MNAEEAKNVADKILVSINLPGIVGAVRIDRATLQRAAELLYRQADDLKAIDGAAKDAHHHFIRYEPDRGEWWGKNHDGVWSFAETFADACRAATGEKA